MDVKSNICKKLNWGKIVFILPFLYLILFSIQCTKEVKKESFISISPNPIFLVRDWDAEYKIIIEGNNQQQAVLGEFKRKNSHYLEFIPVIPLTDGQTYEVIENGKDYLKFTPSKNELSDDYVSTKVLHFYPEVDTVPENLLKMYVQFSRPIDATQNILDHIQVFDVKTKEETIIFLPLENELWNTERTQVTLWLDPGRIKKDLIPNKERGIPISKGRVYKIVVKNSLKDSQGQSIESSMKLITVGPRDQESPKLSNWIIKTPKKGTKEALKIDFNESLDAILLREVIRVYDSKNQLIKGSVELDVNAKSVYFNPDKKWITDNFTIEVESRLEDLAGNNLNRLFDVDLQKIKAVDNSKMKSLSFVIQ